jgi:hypothetical protein
MENDMAAKRTKTPIEKFLDGYRQQYFPWFDAKGKQGFSKPKKMVTRRRKTVEKAAAEG